GKVLHTVCADGGWRGDYYGRRAFERWRAASSAECVCGMPWTAMRILHAGTAAFHGAPVEEECEAEREGDSEGDRGEYVPMHRLSKYSESYSHGGGRDGETIADGDQVQRRIYGKENAGGSLRFSGGSEPVLSVAAGLSE